MLSISRTIGTAAKTRLSTAALKDYKIIVKILKVSCYILTVVHVVHPRFDAPATINLFNFATPNLAQKSVTASIA
jgi:hypothetical protein